MKNADTSGTKGYDAGKEVSGIKRPIAVDTGGLPHAVFITAADVNDRQGCLSALSCRAGCLTGVKKILVDGGYTGQPFVGGVDHLLPGVEVGVVKRDASHTFKVLPKCWVVGRSFAWLEKCRRLWKNGERLPNNSLQMVNMAFLSLLLRRL